MPMTDAYSESQPSRADIDALEGPVVLDFGTNWCGHCNAARPAVAKAFDEHPHLRHVKVEDGPGRPLGRSFGIKLWPTLVFLRDGKEVARVVRPLDAKPVSEAMALIN
ncbi:MAG: putative thioredoxin-disulfide reductase [Rhizobacter sp.]|nr:putative thioredoxin-disulfide reductase [Rhizobacter sp.]